MSTFNAIPDAPVSGTIHGTPFVARDMRFVVDDRVAYAHIDIKLSAGKSEDKCSKITPDRPSSVWLHLDGKHEIPPKRWDRPRHGNEPRRELVGPLPGLRR